MHPFLTIADQAARAAGQRIIQASKSLKRIKTYEKNESFSTEVDHEVEQLIIQHIRSAYPTHHILAEESGMIQGNSDYLWIIDPLDGTNNFIHGSYDCAISIAVKKNNIVEQALIYNPLMQETFIASRGQGARLNQKRLRVSLQLHLRKSLIYLNSPSQNKIDLDYWSAFSKILTFKKSGIRCLGSVALGLAYVAAGRLDGFISCSASKLWDIAAGTLMIQEAGGMVHDREKTNDYLNTGKIIAANPKLIDVLVALDKEMFTLT